MVVVWPIVISLTLGVLCGAWMPLFPFVIISLIGTFGSAIIIWSSGYGIGYALIDVVCVAIALQAGYVGGLLGLLGASKVEPRDQASVVKYKPKHDTHWP